MRKVLIIGPDFFDYNQSIERAFIKLGFETRVIGYTPGQVRSLKEKFHFHITGNKDRFFNKIKKDFNQDVSDLYNSFQPDLLFLIQGNYIFKSTVEMMKCKKVLWAMDSIFRGEVYELRRSLDFIFVFEKTDVDKLWQAEKIKARFLPLALDEAVYFPTNQKRDIDILFVGALYENRIRLLKQIIRRFPKSSIKIYGRYYSPFRRPLHHFFRKDKKAFLNKNISPRDVNEIYNRSKICVNIHHSQSQYGVNQRFFEISGSRSFQLLDRNAYVQDNFSDEEIAIYHSEEDLFEKIEVFLKDRTKADAIAQKAYEKVLEKHTFRHRINQVLEIVNG